MSVKRKSNKSRRRRTPPIEDKRTFTYQDMRRAAEIGMAYGYYFAYLDYGLKPGEDLDIAKATNMARDKVRETINAIEGVAFVEMPKLVVDEKGNQRREGGVRLDVLKEAVEAADREEYSLVHGIVVRRAHPSKGKKRDGTLREAVRRLVENEGLTSPEEIAERTMYIRFRGKLREPVKHKTAVRAELRKKYPNLLK